MIKVGSISAIWRYPVKGMAGESIDSCHIDQNGLNGDRLYAVRDVARDEIQSCKFRPDLLSCIARSSNPQPVFDRESCEIHFPDGTVLAYDDDAIHEKISATLGHESTLESLRPASEADFYCRYKADDHTWFEELKATFTREPGEPLPDFSNPSQEFIDYVTQPGTFFLVSPFHIITSATMQHFKSFHPDADWDIRRFRPNIVIDTVDSINGLAEQSWLDKTLHIGSTQINCSSTAPRCGAVTRKQQDFGFDKSMLRTIVKEAEQNLGIYADINGSAILNVGDEVYLAD
jgi:hypothetical protein